MSEVNIMINGRSYEIQCDPGQEGRIVDLAGYIDGRLQQIARSGGAYNDPHLMVLTALVLADELFDTHEKGASGSKKSPAAATAASAEEEQMLSKMLEQLTKRIDGIAAKVQAA